MFSYIGNPNLDIHTIDPNYANVSDGDSSTESKVVNRGDKDHSPIKLDMKHVCVGLYLVKSRWLTHLCNKPRGWSQSTHCLLKITTHVQA